MPKALHHTSSAMRMTAQHRVLSHNTTATCTDQPQSRSVGDGSKATITGAASGSVSTHPGPTLIPESFIIVSATTRDGPGERMRF